MTGNTDRRRVLIIGGGGFIGQHTVLCLKQSGIDVCALDHFRPSGFDDIDWIIGSTFDKALVAALAGSCDSVIYLAASSLPSTSNADLSAEISAHVELAVKTAELCAAQGVKTFLFASSGGTVYGAQVSELLSEDMLTLPLTAYGVSKLSIENYLNVLSRSSGMRCISLRIANPFGPGQRASRQQGFIGAAMAAGMADTKLSIWGDGSVIRDFIYVGDVALAFCKCCSYEGQSCVINIGSGRGLNLIQVLSEVEQAIGRPIRLEFKPDRSFDVRKNILDIRRAATLINWQPIHSLSHGLRLTAQWWLNL